MSLQKSKNYHFKKIQVIKLKYYLLNVLTKNNNNTKTRKTLF